MRHSPTAHFPNGVQRLVAYCPFCDTQLTRRGATVLGHGQTTQLLYVSCWSCASSVLVLVLVGELGYGSIGVVTDLSEGEIRRFTGGDADTVSPDDVLEVHRLFQREASA